jgi:hypothetical protein
MHPEVQLNPKEANMKNTSMEWIVNPIQGFEISEIDVNPLTVCPSNYTNCDGRTTCNGGYSD